MSATEELKHEHRVIERMLSVLEKAAEKVEQGGELPPDFFNRAVDFIRNFADRCHHGKEEENLFPEMEKKGIGRETGPLGVMLLEHEKGRAFVRGMAEAGERYAKGDKSALPEAIENARGYAQLLWQHIDKEDNILYNMADMVLTPQDQLALTERFEAVEQERIGSGKHEQYVAMVEKMAQEVGLP
ncbi:MAG: hemerythrin domain-containing protein [Chloroflexota bacterium]